MKRLVFLFLLPTLALAIYDMDSFDLNHWKAPFYNDGRWGTDYGIGSGQADGSWPQPFHNCYIFGAGCWVGSIVGPDTLVTVGCDPLTGGTEMCHTLCRYWREGTGDMRDRVYKYPGDWPPSHSRFPMAPLWQLSDMDMWCCYCDSDPSNHDSLGRPLGVDAYQTVYGFSDSLAQDFFFLRYEIANCSGDSIRHTYFGMMLDPDIGNATDDMSGLILDHLFHVGPDTIRVRNTAFAYDYDNIENHSAVWDSGTPGTVALMLLSAPDSLGLTACKRFTIDIDPASNPTQYLTLAGFNYRTGVYEPYDTGSYAPGDVRMLLSTGPFNLAPDSTVTFWYAVIGSPFGEAGQTPPLRDTSDLALRCKWALEFWRRLFPGIAEETPGAEVRMANAATLVRGILFLPGAASRKSQAPSCLLDISGRKVMSLKPGANDVSRLSPGVYFVREAQAKAQAQATRNVIVAK
jgi:hypothetical protein